MLTVLLITLQRYNKFVFVPNFFFRFFSTTVDKHPFFWPKRPHPPPFLSIPHPPRHNLKVAQLSPPI